MPRIAAGFAVLLAFQVAGEALVALTSLPVPGPVAGMALLLAALLIRGAVPDFLERTAEGLLVHLSLLFVPAGAGVMIHAGLAADAWLALLLAVVPATLVALAVSGLAMQAFCGRRPPGNGTTPDITASATTDTGTDAGAQP